MRSAQRVRRGKLLGLAPLGQGQGGGVAGPHQFGAPPYYLISDTFTTDRAAGAVGGTDAEPGPGRRVVGDTLSKLTISAGALRFAVGSAANNPQLRHSAPIPRSPGRLLKSAFAMSVVGAELGWESNFSGSPADGLRFTGTTIAARVDTGASVIAVATPATGVTYQMAMVLRAAGAFHFLKGGAFTNWTLLWLSGASTYSSAYTAATATGATGVFTVDYIRVPAALWLPAPLLSHGFSVLTPSDGLGHAEGAAGGLGAGGDALAMSSYYGTWSASGGVAQCTALAGGIGLLGRDVGTANTMTAVKVTRGGGVAGLFVRENADDRVVAVHNGTNAQLIKRVAGVNTTLIDVAATYVAGAELRLICQGTAFRLFYNNVAIGSEQTISDASLQAETLAGIYTTSTTNNFDDLVVRARGTGGEYAALDAF